jgi:hypothetical protein
VYNTDQAKGEVVQYFFPNMDSDGKIQGTIGFAMVSKTE